MTKDSKLDELKKEYKKYQLPDFDEFNRNFQISGISPDDFSLNAVRRRIVEKIEKFSDMVEDILQPDVTIQSLYESKAFDEEKRKGIFDIYKKLKGIERQSAIVEIDSADKQNIEFINNTFNEWMKLKAKLKPILEELRQSWEKEDIHISSEHGYFG